MIESAGAKTKKAVSIKSHHNVGGLPESLHLKLIEPLRELFQDEVREPGLALGLPREMVFRHPFPGPGLGVRILGSTEKTYVDLLQRADDIFIQELRNSGWYDKTAQAFAVFLPVKSVGVMGGGRTYDVPAPGHAGSSAPGAAVRTGPCAPTRRATRLCAPVPSRGKRANRQRAVPRHHTFRRMRTRVNGRQYKGVEEDRPSLDAAWPSGHGSKGPVSSAFAAGTTASTCPSACRFPVSSPACATSVTGACTRLARLTFEKACRIE